MFISQTAYTLRRTQQNRWEEVQSWLWTSLWRYTTVSRNQHPSWTPSAGNCSTSSYNLQPIRKRGRVVSWPGLRARLLLIGKLLPIQQDTQPGFITHNITVRVHIPIPIYPSYPLRQLGPHERVPLSAHALCSKPGTSLSLDSSRWSSELGGGRRPYWVYTTSLLFQLKTKIYK